MKITIILCAYKIKLEAIQNFLKWNRKLFTKYKINVAIVVDRPIESNQRWVEYIEYPKNQTTFSIGKTINYGIKRIKDNGIIMKTDIDILFSEEVIKHILYSTNKRSGCVCLCAYAGNPKAINYEAWKDEVKIRAGYGACFAMMKEDWERLCGYDERICGWGADDTEMLHRARKTMQIYISDEYPLYHISHGTRHTGKYFFKNLENRKFLAQLNWDNPNWGEADDC